MNKVTPLAPSFTAEFSRRQRAKIAGARVSPANEAAPSPAKLNDLFRQELLEFGPAMMMCDPKGQITWANAASRRIAETRIDGGTIGERLRLAEIAEEMDFRRTTVFRDWDFAAGGAMQRLRARFEPMIEAGGLLTGFGGMLTLLQDGMTGQDEATTALDRHMDFIRLSSDWMWETDAALNLRLVTQRVVGALGMVPQQLIGRNLLDLVSVGGAARQSAAPAPEPVAVPRPALRCRGRDRQAQAVPDERAARLRSDDRRAERLSRLGHRHHRTHPARREPARRQGNGRDRQPRRSGSSSPI